MVSLSNTPHPPPAACGTSLPLCFVVCPDTGSDLWTQAKAHTYPPSNKERRTGCVHRIWHMSQMVSCYADMALPEALNWQPTAGDHRIISPPCGCSTCRPSSVDIAEVQRGLVDGQRSLLLHAGRKFFLPECYAAFVHCCLVCSCHSQQQDVAIQRETWLRAARLRGFKINRRQDGLHFIPHPPFLYAAICCILCGLLIKTNLFSLYCECWQNTKVKTNYNMKLFVETSLETWWYCGDRWLNKPELIWPLGTNTLTFFFMLVFQWLE